MIIICGCHHHNTQSTDEHTAFKPIADLPPLLEFIDGRKVETIEQWP